MLLLEKERGGREGERGERGKGQLLKYIRRHVNTSSYSSTSTEFAAIMLFSRGQT